jgi:hypothetical protein
LVEADGADRHVYPGMFQYSGPDYNAGTTGCRKPHLAVSYNRSTD